MTTLAAPVAPSVPLAALKILGAPGELALVVATLQIGRALAALGLTLFGQVALIALAAALWSAALAGGSPAFELPLVVPVLASAAAARVTAIGFWHAAPFRARGRAR